MFAINNNLGFKILIAVIILFLISFIFNNSYSLQNIDNLAYVVALGLDTSENNNYKLTIQLAKPNNILSSSSSSSSEQSSSSVITSVDCSSIMEGINLIDSHISRTINLSHCEVIVISESLARNDITQIVQTLIDNIQISTHANMIFSKCDASNYLELTNPTLESYSARYYHVINSSEISTAYTEAVSLMDFHSILNNNFQEPVGVLSGINTQLTHVNYSQKSFANKDNSYIAGETPFTTNNHIENMGIAVFKDNKFVGELNGLESTCHLITTGKLKYSIIQINNPSNPSELIDLKIQLRKKNKTSVEIINNSPLIKQDIYLYIRIDDFFNDVNVYELEEYINSFTEDIITNYLYKTAKVYNSDIDGFGKYALKHFSTINEWENFNWLDNYQNSFFKVNVNSKIDIHQ